MMLAKGHLCKQLHHAMNTYNFLVSMLVNAQCWLVYRLHLITSSCTYVHTVHYVNLYCKSPSRYIQSKLDCMYVYCYYVVCFLLRAFSELHMQYMILCLRCLYTVSLMAIVSYYMLTCINCKCLSRYTYIEQVGLYVYNSVFAFTFNKLCTTYDIVCKVCIYRIANGYRTMSYVCM